jgi:adenosine tuberculosinyltransferase
MKAERFKKLSAREIAHLVNKAGTKVCTFPINGTRRWFMLEHTPETSDEAEIAARYLDAAGRRHIELYRMLFEHGLETVLTPVFGPDLLERGEGYMKMAAAGLARLATHPDFLHFYEEHGVQVRFYGDYRKFFAGTACAFLSDVFDEVTARTQHHQRHRLFYGVCAHDATETIAELSINYHLTYGNKPDKKTLVELYYGAYVPPVNLFIGFDKFSVFDMPLVATGNEDLYFTVSPSLYMTESQLRDILYDHLYTRRQKEKDYTELSRAGRKAMRQFYQQNIGTTLGIGAVDKRAGFWYPMMEVKTRDDGR